MQSFVWLEPTHFFVYITVPSPPLNSHSILSSLKCVITIFQLLHEVLRSTFLVSKVVS